MLTIHNGDDTDEDDEFHEANTTKGNSGESDTASRNDGAANGEDEVEDPLQLGEPEVERPLSVTESPPAGQSSSPDSWIESTSFSAVGPEQWVSVGDICLIAKANRHTSAFETIEKAHITCRHCRVVEFPDHEDVPDHRQVPNEREVNVL